MADEMFIYESIFDTEEIEVLYDGKTVWLTQAQLAKLLNVTRPTITKRINQILDEQEFSEFFICSVREHINFRNRTYRTKLYNLDIIISLGYRLNPQRMNMFRIWVLEKFGQRPFSSNA